MKVKDLVVLEGMDDNGRKWLVNPKDNVVTGCREKDKRAKTCDRCRFRNTFCG